MLHKIWTNKFFDSDSDDGELVISEAVWKRVGADMDSSRKLIPASYGRAPRNIHKYYGSWKAEEWCSFLLYYSPILLLDALPTELYKHYMKLVMAVEIAIDYEITHEEINEVKKLLSEFVSDYERLYYQYDKARLPLCLPTIHLLLHLGQSLENCGPAWAYWQYPCERICGMLKPKCKNRALANRTLSIRIVQDEQLNHLQFVSDYTESLRRVIKPDYSGSIENREYGFLHPCQSTLLMEPDAETLAQFYTTILEGRFSKREILSDPVFIREIRKYARCKLLNDKDIVSSQWSKSRRDVDVVRQASNIQYVYRGEKLGYGRVLFFFLHKYYSNWPHKLAFRRTLISNRGLLCA